VVRQRHVAVAHEDLGFEVPRERCERHVAGAPEEELVDAAGLGARQRRAHVEDTRLGEQALELRAVGLGIRVQVEIATDDDRPAGRVALDDVRELVTPSSRRTSSSGSPPASM
jgi:hypothetical protein